MPVLHIRAEAAGEEPWVLESAILSYLTALVVNGQVARLDRYLTSVSSDAAEGFAILAFPDALDERYQALEVFRARDRLESVARVTERVGSGEEKRTTVELDWRAEELLMVFSAGDGQGPVSTGEAVTVPTCTLPVPWQLKDELWRWHECYGATWKMWLLPPSRRAETCAYREMTSADSGLAATGRKLARELEERLEKPVYYFLRRDYADADGDADLRCPGCGSAEWRTGEDMIAFRCAPCRLASEVGPTIDRRLSRIGAWRRPK